MTTREVAERIKKMKNVKVIKERMIRRWASENDVPSIGEGNRKDYIFSEEDFQRFLNRDKPGRRWE